MPVYHVHEREEGKHCRAAANKNHGIQIKAAFWVMRFQLLTPKLIQLICLDFIEIRMNQGIHTLGGPTGIRTPVTSVRGWRPGPLDDGALTGQYLV